MRTAVFALLVLPLGLAGCSGPDIGPTADATSPSMPPTRDALGTLEAVRPQGNLTEIVLHARIVDCDRTDAAWNITADLGGMTLPPLGSEVALSFAYTDGAWRPWMGNADPDAYVAQCRERHAEDVRVLPVTRERVSGNIAQILPGVVLLGGETTFTTPLKNVADDPVEVRIDDVALVNEDARVLVPGCAASVAPASFTLDDAHEVRVTVRCDADADPRPAFTSCREGGWVPGPAGGEATYDPGHACRMERAPRPTATVHGVLSFTDELGGEHRRNVTLSGPLHVALDATLTLEVPASVSDGDAFVVVARYADAEGRAIEAAQVALSLEWPGLEDHAFGMDWDEELQAYRFTWDDLMEWKPWIWREGPHRVRVEALEPVNGIYAPREAEAVVEFV